MRGRVGRPGLVGTAARTAVIAGTASAVSGRVQRRQTSRAQQEAYEQQQQYAASQPQYAPVEQQAAPPPPPPPAPAAPAMGTDDMIARLQKLGELRQQGILTDEEFAAQKAKLLG